MTPFLLPSAASHRQSNDRRPARLRAAKRIAGFIAGSIAPFVATPLVASIDAQPLQEAPIVPSSTIGSVANSSTFSVLGVTALPEAGASIGNRNVLWFAATQPAGRLGGVKFTALGSGYYRPSDAPGGRDATEGIVSFRALARVGGMRTWTAVSMGRSSAEGIANSEGLAPAPANLLLGNATSDTTLLRREDLGKVSRAEIGLLTTSGQVEFAFGVSIERATRVTTQRVQLAENPIFDPALVQQFTTATERRDVATGLASASFRTGATDWLVSVSSPFASWMDNKVDAPRPQRTPTVASIAFMQPLTAWLSVVGAASTNATTVGSYALRDDRADGRRSDFAPVVALGVRIASFSLKNRPGEPRGILAFETRTIGIIDSVTAETLAIDSLTIADVETGRELVRVLLVIDAPRAESVELMGDATSWNVTSMSRARDGKWRAELRVPPGMHRVAVRADGGNWIAPPGLPMSTDDFGSRVGLLVVKVRNN